MRNTEAMDLRSIFILSTMFSGVGGINVTIPQKQYQHHKGDNVTISCHFKSHVQNPSTGFVSWSILEFKDTELSSYGSECFPHSKRMTFLESSPSRTKMICKPSCCEEILVLMFYFNLNETKTQIYKSEYESRVSMEKGSDWAEFKLFNITVRDSAFLMCRVQIPEDEEGLLEAVAELIVYAPPSLPVCEVKGKVEQGQNITLHCASEESSPRAVYSWKSPDVLDQSFELKQSSTRSGGFLYLNITKDSPGLYICTSSNMLKSETCTITLSIDSDSKPSVSLSGLSDCLIRLIVTGIGLIIIATTVIVIVIYYRFCQRKKEEGGIYEFMKVVEIE